MFSVTSSYAMNSIKNQFNKKIFFKFKHFLFSLWLDKEKGMAKMPEGIRCTTGKPLDVNDLILVREENI